MRITIISFFLCVSFILITSCDKSSHRDIQYKMILQYQDSRAKADSIYPFLRDKDELVRGLAIQALGQMEDSSAVDTLIAILQENNDFIREKAVIALGQTGFGRNSRTVSGKIEKTLWDAPDHSNSGFAQIIEAVGKAGTEQSAGFIRKHLAHQNELIIGKACIASARLALRGIKSPAIDSALVPLLQRENSSLRWKTVYAMMRIQSPVFIPLLIRSLKDKDEFARMNASRALGAVKQVMKSDSHYSKIVDALMEAASNDDSWMVRVNAVTALGQFKFKTDDLKKAYFLIAFEGKKDPNEHVRLAAIRSMAGSYKQDLKNKNEFINLITDHFMPTATWREKTATLSALSVIFGKTVLDNPGWKKLLDSCLRDSNRYCRAQAVESVNSINDDRVIPYLDNALRDSFELVQINALTVLGNIKSAQSRQILAGAIKTTQYTVFMTALSILSEDKNVLADKRLCETIIRTANEQYDSLKPVDDEEAIIEILNSAAKFKVPEAEVFLSKFVSHPNRKIASHAAVKLRENYRKDIFIPADTVKSVKPVDYLFLSKLKSQSPVAVIKTERGDIEMDFYFDEAPLTVMNFVKLAEKKFYDGQYFHRVVSNFVIQAGDPGGTGWGGPGYSIRSEFSNKPYERGSVGMASSGKDTEGSQWFICHSPQPHLEGRYTVFGKVRAGMEVVDQIQVGDKIISVRINRF